MINRQTLVSSLAKKSEGNHRLIQSFTLTEDDPEISYDNKHELNIEDWKKQMNPIGFFECCEISPDGTQQSPG